LLKEEVAQLKQALQKYEEDSKQEKHALKQALQE